MSTVKSLQFYNPIESKMAQGYTNQDFIGELAAPRITVAKRNGEYLKLVGKEAFKTYDSARGRGGRAKRISFEHSTAEYSIKKTHFLEAAIDDEEDEQTLGIAQINLVTQNREILQSSLALEREKEIASLITNVANYGTNHGSVTTNWTTNTADVLSDWLDANETIRSKTGKYADTGIVSAKTFRSLQKNTKLLEYYKYTTTTGEKGVLNADMIASALGLERLLVGKAVAADASGTFSDVWGTSFAALIITAKPASPGVLDPSRIDPGFAFTLQHMKYPRVKEYRDEPHNSTIVRVEEAWVVVQTSTEAGYFFEGTLA